MDIAETGDDRMRVCYRGVLTHEEAQAKIGNEYRVLDLRSATCLDETGQLVQATEVIFDLL